ncbi:MAG: bacterial type and secretion system family protein [Micavibrio sp.]|nr:bacterial type and secretion system family protein [Micavibrio sp.]
MTKMSGLLKNIGGISCVILTLSLATVSLSGCDLLRNNLKIDRSGNMETQDYRDGLAPRIAQEDEKGANAAPDAAIPDLQAYIASPSKDLKPMPLVSISVNQTVPLRDALFELASQAGYDIELDPRIKGSIIFTAREKPFDLVIDRISDIANLRYKFENNILRVEMDSPFQKVYKIDYLSFVRKNTSSINNDISVVTGGGANAGSKFQAANTSEADFWGELNTGLSQILGVPQSQGSMMTAKDPTITAAPANPVAVEAVAAPGADGKTAPVAAPAATLQVQSLPTGTADTAAAPAAAPVAGQSPDGSTFSMNKQAGMISVNATERQHKLIEAYLKELRRSVSSQVLIEAKVLEVSLTDEFAAGVNWNTLKNMFGEFSLGFGAVSTASAGLPGFDPASLNPTSLAQFAYNGNDITALVQALDRFGTVKALASPRLMVLNNQSAVLNVANNQVYFEVKVDVTAGTNGSATQTTVNSTIHTVPEGVLINVQPSINLDDQSVSMAVRPTITRITSYVNDPGVAYVTQANNISGITSRVPVVNVQEMDSVLKINSGQTLVMGGLMQDRTQSTQQGTPVLSEIPMFGALFRNQGDKVSKTELVVLMKATIVDGSNISDTDKDLYKKFSDDRRPTQLN